MNFGDGKCIAILPLSDNNSVINGTLTNQNHYECRIKFKCTVLAAQTDIDSAIPINNNTVVECLMTINIIDDYPETIHPINITIIDISSSDSLPVGINSDKIG